MESPKAVVERMLPNGTSEAGNWADLPYWPPDLFAVVATIADLSGCYARTRYLCGFDHCAFDEHYRDEISTFGLDYARGVIPARCNARGIRFGHRPRASMTKPRRMRHGGMRRCSCWQHLMKRAPASASLSKTRASHI
jgi:hypothetical protein